MARAVLKRECLFYGCRERFWTWEAVRKHIYAHEGASCICPAASFAHDLGCPDRRLDGGRNFTMQRLLRQSHAGHPRKPPSSTVDQGPEPRTTNTSEQEAPDA